MKVNYFMIFSKVLVLTVTKQKVTTIATLPELTLLYRYNEMNANGKIITVYCCLLLIMVCPGPSFTHYLGIMILIYIVFQYADDTTVFIRIITKNGANKKILPVG